jgi:glycerol-3-phosphate acyltransferase PlsY
MDAMALLGVIGAYLMGAVPFGYLLFRAGRGQDIRRHGSGNIGATNVARTMGPVAGLVTLLLDVGKGALAVGVARRLGLQPAWLAAVGLAAIVGHAFPLFLGFRGGKSVAVALGVFALLAPRAAVSAVAVFLLVLGIGRYVSIASVSAALSFPLCAWLLGYGPEVVAAGAGAALLIAAKHHANWRRLLSGTEHRLELRRASRAAP